MRAFNIYNSNISTIKKFLVESKAATDNDQHTGHSLMMDLDTDEIYIKTNFGDNGRTNIAELASNAIYVKGNYDYSNEPMTAIKQRIINILWSQAETEAALADSQNVAEFEILGDDVEFEEIDSND